MKKVLTAVLTVISVFCMCAFMSACSSGDVSGKTYVLFSYEFDRSSFSAEDMDKLYPSVLNAGARFGSALSFSDDGRVVSDTLNTRYEKNGNKIKIDGYTFEISGDELRCFQNVSGFSFGDLRITTVYKQR